MRNRTETQIKILLIRHGATKSNSQHRYLGRTDEPLSMKGRIQLQRAKQAALYPKADCVFSSPMQRCRQTAEILYPDREIILIPEWEEMDFGDFEGKNYAELQGDARFQQWLDSNAALPFPNGECREDFIRRCRQGLYRMRKLLDCQETRPGQNVTAGLIVHGGTIMSLVSTFYGGAYFDYQVPNGQGYVCTLKGAGDCLKITEIQKIGAGGWQSIF